VPHIDPDRGLARCPGSVDALARRVGVVPSAIYRHCPSKGAVRDALLGLISRRVEEIVAAVRWEVSDPLGRLRFLLARHVQSVCGDAGILRVVFSEEALACDGARRSRLHRVTRGYLARVGAIIRTDISEYRETS